MTVRIDEIVVSVEVSSSGSGNQPPNNSDLDNKLKKAIAELKNIIKTRNER